MMIFSKEVYHMNNKVCPTCGEEYSATYRTCPFCEEEEAIAHGTPIHRRGGKRLDNKGRSAGGVGGVLLVMGLVVILGLAAYALLGDRIQDTMGIRDPSTLSEDDGGKIQGGAVSLSGQDESDHSDDATPPGTAGDGEPVPLALNFTNIRINAGETGLLSASGGPGGNVEWSTSNEKIATVENGSVTGVAGGDATITAVCGEESVSCTVTVLGDPYVSDLKLKLNKDDFTFGQSDPSVQMKVLLSGTSEEYGGTVTWASNNTSVATISGSGLVKWVGKGTTKVTATVDGQVLECIVRAH